jgi:hypothetical protein
MVAQSKLYMYKVNLIDKFCEEVFQFFSYLFCWEVAKSSVSLHIVCTTDAISLSVNLRQIYDHPAWFAVRRVKMK